MKLFKKLGSKLLPNFAYFYRYLGYRMVILLLTSIFVGLMDGLGLAMFIPLLELVANPAGEASADTLGNLSFVLDGLEWIGLSLSLKVVLLSMFAFFVFKGIAIFIERYLRVVYQQYFIAKIRIENIRALSNYSYNAFVTADAGAIQNTLTGEVDRVTGAFLQYSNIIQQSIIVLTYALLAFVASPEFSILIIIGGVISNLVFNNLYKKTKLHSGALVTKNHLFQGYVIQSVAFFKYLSATAKINKYAVFLEQRVMEIEKTNRKMGVLSSIMLGVREPMMIGIVVTVILLQVYVLGGELSMIILSLLLFYRALVSLTALQTSYNQFLGYSGSLENMSKFTKNLKSHPRNSGSLIFEGFKDYLTLSNVDFSYYNSNPILKSISLEFKKNESVAFVGESGSGKTTLLNILAGLINPTKGEYRIDGKLFSELDLNSFQSRIGYITQDPVIFDDTVFNNVTFWDERNDRNLKRFEEALRKAHIYEFVLSLAEAENTRLGNNGISLSGGQKQRISIARELYKEVDFLFMDEATSALDSETERNIQESIEELKGSYTIIIIAHRLSTVKNVDRIIVLDKGKIDLIGSYTFVSKKSKVFQKYESLQRL